MACLQKHRNMSYLQGSGIVQTDWNWTVVFLLEKSRMLLKYIYFSMFMLHLSIYNFLKDIKKVFPTNIQQKILISHYNEGRTVCATWMNI